MLRNKISILGLAILALIPWKIFYTKYKLHKRLYEERLLFKKRHNCVVTYASNKGMSGWPPYKERIVCNIQDKHSLDHIYEPIVFFIETAEKTIDIAYMMIRVQKIFDSLMDAHKRGVKIRLLMNFEHCKSNLSPIRQCLIEGINVQLYISHKATMESIMHYKYIIKDFEQGKGGYVLNGSMNLTGTAFLENYEDIVFSTDSYLTKSFNDNFEQCWNYVEVENQNILNKAILLDVNLI